MATVRKSSGILTFVAFMVLALVIVFLVSGPHLFSSTISFIDTELAAYSNDAQPIRVKVDLSEQEKLDDFPYLIGDWQGRDEDTEGLKEQLGANTLIKRAYHLENPFQPVFLLLMQSVSKTSFHPPTVCYPALGYEIEEETKDILYVKDTTWVDKWYDLNFEDLPGWAKEGGKSPQYGEISVKKLIISDQEKADRRVVLYMYIKDKKITSNNISMLRVSAIAPPTGSYEEANAQALQLMGEVIPYMFDPDKQEEKTFFTRLTDMGTGGYFLIILLFSVPVAIFLYSVIMSRRRTRDA